MHTPIIEIKGIGKKYNITHQRGGYIALRDVLANILKNPFGFLKHKVMQVAGLETKEEFWALRNINIEIQKGDIIGIIGHNGAGKSTLLKILTGITPPTEGEIIMRGRVASLLEVGTGFHPELTGRENIFLNGAILGMTKKEIVKKFDEIIAFAGVEKFLDTPVKYYSSGMYVRLAFSVAAHMEPDILLVDEVLAVGDAEFQKKCLGKMEEVTRKDGRTIFLVSHNMGAIKMLCQKTLWLEDGEIKEFGNTDTVTENYLHGTEKEGEKRNRNIVPDSSKDITFTKVWVTNMQNTPTTHIFVDEDFTIHTEFNVNKPMDTAEISIFLRNSNGINITFTNLSDVFNQKPYSLKKGTYITSTTIPKNFLMADDYVVRLAAHERGIRDIDAHENILRLSIIDNGSPMTHYGKAARNLALVLCNSTWNIARKNND
ncbi:MAG: ABC transporter ATP-binding protein [Patescibacteria group bacterium]